MKKILLTVLTCLFILSCNTNDAGNNNCNFLLNIGVNMSINLNLSQFSQLQFVSNSVYVANVANGGIIVTNTGSGFLAWDASDPNRSPSSCSTLKIEGLEAVSSCDDKNTYSLITGQALGNSNLRCGLKNYRITQNGNTLFISN